MKERSAKRRRESGAHLGVPLKSYWFTRTRSISSTIESTSGQPSSGWGVNPAKEHLERAIAIYDPEHHQTLALRYLGFDAAVYCLSGMALTLWQLGYPDQALMRGNGALALAQRLSDPQSLVLAERFLGEVHLFRREANAAKENAESLINRSAERGFSEWIPRATTLRGGAIVLLGRHEEGIAQIQEGLAALRATRFELWRTPFLCLLAEAYRATIE
jgi:predicted ATPase